MNRIFTIGIDRHTNKTVHIQPGGDNELFYSNSSAEARCIGSLRMDADNYGKLWTSWWPHSAAQKYNRDPFKSEFNALINAIQQTLFCDPSKIQSVMMELGIPCLDADQRYRFFHIDTGAYSYYFRVYPGKGDYSYCYCYAKEGETNG